MQITLYCTTKSCEEILTQRIHCIGNEHNTQLFEIFQLIPPQNLMLHFACAQAVIADQYKILSAIEVGLLDMEISYAEEPSRLHIFENHIACIAPIIHIYLAEGFEANIEQIVNAYKILEPEFSVHEQKIYVDWPENQKRYKPSYFLFGVACKNL